jgi:diketogulonate reductase-like aldo/keto reductase
MNTRTLTTDVEIPYLGFDKYLTPDLDVAAVVSEAIHTGYRHIDTGTQGSFPVPGKNVGGQH